MSDRDKSTSGLEINIGIYGCTQAGKTRFLFQLLEVWKKRDRLLPQSEEALAFLAQVRAEIEKHGKSMPTAATTDGIIVKVRRSADELPWQLTFRDLRGELLTDELPPNGEIARDGVVVGQINSCDAFLFFFDPASSKNPSGIEKHHQDELKRAEMFVEHVLKVRQNRLLPIVFIQTHLDQWSNEAEVRSRAERWMNDVHSKMADLYGSRLDGLHPASFVDRRRIAFAVSSVINTAASDKQLDEVIEHLSDLVVEGKKHERVLREKGRRPLVAGICVIILLVIVVLWLIFGKESPDPPKPGNDRPTIARMPEKDIVEELTKLDELLRSHPRGSQLPDITEAKSVNHHLRWLTQRLEPGSDGLVGVSEETQQRMRSTLESAATLIYEKSEDSEVSASVLTPVISAYLEDLPNLKSTSPTLAGVQKSYWHLQRTELVEQIADILKRRLAIASTPIDTLGEVANKLRAIEREISRCKVFSLQERPDLVREIQTAITFCEDRRTSKTYMATIRIAGSLDKLHKQWGNLRIRSPGHADEYSRDGISLNPKVDGLHTSISTTQDNYRLTLGLGTPVSMILAVYEGQGNDGRPKYTTPKEIDLTEKQNERGVLEALGLPLHSREKANKHLQVNGYDLQITIFDFSPVPELLWDAASQAKERKP